MMKTIFLFLLILANARGSSLFLPDSDTAALLAIVTNTSSTVAHTLEILDVAKETQQKMEDLNRVAMRRFYLARRIEQHARDVAALKRMKPKNLRELNRALARLKNNLSRLKSNTDTAAKEIAMATKVAGHHQEKLASTSTDEQDAHNQEIQSAGGGKMSAQVQNTAINTALSAKILSKMRRDNLEYQVANLGLQKSRSLEQLRREQHYRNWIGLKGKNK